MPIKYWFIPIWKVSQVRLTDHKWKYSSMSMAIWKVSKNVKFSAVLSIWNVKLRLDQSFPIESLSSVKQCQSLSSVQQCQVFISPNLKTSVKVRWIVSNRKVIQITLATYLLLVRYIMSAMFMSLSKVYSKFTFAWGSPPCWPRWPAWGPPPRQAWGLPPVPRCPALGVLRVRDYQKIIVSRLRLIATRIIAIAMRLRYAIIAIAILRYAIIAISHIAIAILPSPFISGRKFSPKSQASGRARALNSFSLRVFGFF